MRKLRYLRLLVVEVGMALLFLGLAPAGASSANISHSYHSASPIKEGSLVSLDTSHSDYVLPSNIQNAQRLLGIAVASNDSLLAVDPTAGFAQVATSGSANTLVSTFNGDISVGDQIAVSPFDGIGMKASPGSVVAGLAQTGFTARSEGTTQQITDKNGKTSKIQVGFLRLGIAPGFAASTSTDSQLNSLQKFSKVLTGHAVSTARIIISLVIALVGLASIVTLMYASIYGSIISIGRNPLAKYAVFRSLTSVLAMAGLMAVVAVGTIFLLLR